MKVVWSGFAPIDRGNFDIVPLICSSRFLEFHDVPLNPPTDVGRRERTVFRSGREGRCVHLGGWTWMYRGMGGMCTAIALRGWRSFVWFEWMRGKVGRQSSMFVLLLQQRLERPF